MSLKMWKTSMRNEIFLVVGGRSNAYFIPTAKGNILVDTSVRSDYTKLRRHIKSLHLVSPEVTYLVLTHSHFDHCQNVKQIKEEDECQVILGEHEAECVKKGYTPIPMGAYTFTKFLSQIGKRMGSKRFGYHSFVADILVKDKYELMKEDIKIDLISTPGHSIGSISVIVDDDIAIVGDTIIGVISDWIYPPFADDGVELISSWQKLLTTGCTLFLPGHGSPITRAMLEKNYHKYAEKFQLEDME